MTLSIPIQNGYRPRFSDSALAGATPSDEFMQGFKQSLLSDHQDLIDSAGFTSYDLSVCDELSTKKTPQDPNSVTDDSPATGTASMEAGSTLGRSDIAYPLSLFDSLPEPPSTDTMDHLMRVFQEDFLQKAPFLSNISGPVSSGLNSASGVPSYLAFSKALLATLFSSRCHDRRWSWNLYNSGVKTFVGSVELDNRTCRNHLWYQAGILLVTFGMLQANRSVWHTINILNGYFLAPYKRNGLLQIRSFESTPEHHDLVPLTSFYFLVDLLRAIYTNTPPSIDPSQLSFPIKGCEDLDLETIYQRIIFLHQPLSSLLSCDTYLLGLLCILSETVLLLRFLGPLADRNAELPRRPPDAQINEMAQRSFVPRAGAGPLAPSAASREYLQQVESLTISITSWHRSVNSPEPCAVKKHGESLWSLETCLVDQGVLALAYFCRIFLEVGPRALTLPQIFGYPRKESSEMYGHAFSNDQTWGSVIQVSDVAMECAWKILDICDSYETPMNSDDDTDPTMQAPSAVPIWMPLVVFYAALIVWCRMRDDHHKGILRGAQNSLSARRRIMKNFQSVLRRMGRHFECATCMADTIESLDC